MKIMLSAGEASGDLHGAALAKAFKELNDDVEIVGFGGDMMENAGVNLWANYKSYNVMGVLEVVLNLRRILNLLDFLAKKIEEERPDLLVLIDYPDFNWRLAKKAKALGVK
ncbi:MAG: lipid-A-disaccharide synthase, partial [Selenomonadaceae bacterium]|nr:lipid-A-disaccharide synthase [Selenomonadaceae bacterium]